MGVSSVVWYFLPCTGVSFDRRGHQDSQAGFMFSNILKIQRTLSHSKGSRKIMIFFFFFLKKRAILAV